MAACLYSQSKVTFIVNEETRIKHDSIFLAGTFNNWDANANPRYLLKPYGNNKKAITIDVPNGAIEYKFHRGNWASVEKAFNFDEIPNRIINIEHDTTLEDKIMEWQDEFLVNKWFAISNSTEDSTLLFNYAALANTYPYYADFYNADSAIYYAGKAKEVFDKIKSSGKYKDWFKDDNKIYFLFNMQEVNATIFHTAGNYSKSLEIRLDNLSLAEGSALAYMKSDALRSLAILYASMKDYNRMLDCGLKMDTVLAGMDGSKSNWYTYYIYSTNYTIASAYFKLNKPTEALFYAKKLERLNMNVATELYALRTQLLLGDIYALLDDSKAAMNKYDSILLDIPETIHHFGALAWLGKAKLYQKNNQTDSALIYAQKAYMFFKTNNIDALISSGWGENSNYYLSEISPLVANLFSATGYPDSAYKYLQLYVSLKDTLFNNEKATQFQAIILNETSRQQKEAIEKSYLQKQFQSQLKVYGLIACILFFVVLAFTQFRNIKQKQKVNSSLKTALKELKSTQSQLIQSEKMASLGELTTGIAHEIQNPLNFVNNFSELSNELIDELNEELDKGDVDEAKAISSDIKTNLEKINHHGKRADAIVKGMLQHSRKSEGKKEPTDINALCNEYVRLAYHSLRARDKSFNADLKTDFDESLPKINVIPQDIGRVLLNIINNGFQAVQGTKDPTLLVSTKRAGDHIEIKITDNGPGIPDSIKDKIFQPFFTTKPTGQGTGLGLSLSYDIVKAHGGELKVTSITGEGATFTVSLPVW